MLQIRNVSKFFPGVTALDNISLDFAPGEVHAIVGENGAGKSTLIKIICGIYTPDEGEVRLDGEHMHLRSYKDALDHKINLVSQEIQVIPKSTVAENIMLDKLQRYVERSARIPTPVSVPCKLRCPMADGSDLSQSIPWQAPSTRLEHHPTGRNRSRGSSVG